MQKPIWIIAAAVITVSANATEVRTTTWFADHPEARRQVLALCNENPGEAKHQPNCANAFQGDIVAATREAKAHVGSGASPNDPAYWRDPGHAEERRYWALQCERAKTAPIEVQRSMSCPALRAAGE